MTTIMLDASLGRPAKGYTEAEQLFRAEIELEIAAIQASGGAVEVPFGLPDLD
jgi:hypothetical protein